MYIAHTSPNKNFPPHWLSDHTDEVVKIAVEFAEDFDPFFITRVGALMHDQGKKSDEFQAYIQSVWKVRGSVKHALGGAIALMEINDERIDPLIMALICLIVMGHHAGLPNITEIDSKLREAPKELKEIGVRVREQQKEAAEILSKNTASSFKHLETITININWYFSVITRLCFSALVDADWLDTERYFNPEKSKIREYQAPDITFFLEKLKDYMTGLEEQAKKNRLNAELMALRKQIYVESGRVALIKGNFYALIAPTGGGKTLAALSFALEHAKEFNKRRVIFALPLVNVTEQTSAIYRTIFDDEHVIEHHSQAVAEDLSEDENTNRMATENWDGFLIVTTTVQLFESLFSNRPAQSRKLHRIANSIIVLDEYQKIPLHVLKPIFNMLKVLQEKFGVTVLLMSATPLALEESKALKDIGKPIPVLEDFRNVFERMQRVDYSIIEQPLEIVDLVDRMKNHDTVLCIVNTRKDAQRIFEAMKDNKRWDKVYHLSTTMCSDHRLETIQEIKENLLKKQFIAVIATSLLEAGVDLSFSAVFRMFAPLDSIIQAAGRANRNWEDEKGQVFIFDLVDGRSAGELYTQSTLQTRQLLHEVGITALHDPTVCIQYFRKVYRNVGVEGLDRHQIIENPYNFRMVANNFKMIPDDDSVSVLCKTYGIGKKSSFIQEFEADQTSRAWFRIMQPFTITLRLKEVKTRKMELKNGFYIWDGMYDPQIGYKL